MERGAIQRFISNLVCQRARFCAAAQKAKTCWGHPPFVRPPTLSKIQEFTRMSITTHELTDFQTGSILAPLGAMSYRRIILGVLIAASLLAGGLAAAWRFGWPLELAPGVLFVVAAIYSGILCEVCRARALRPYWERGCMGIRWRRRFPEDPKFEIREFLRLFIESFLLKKPRLSRFSPDDRVMDVYRALYPPGGSLADAMELETFAMEVKKRYKIDLAPIWRQDITLGEVYSLTRTK
jgi:propanediol dehydratase small subunit